MKNWSDCRLKKGADSLLDELLVIPQQALQVILGKIWRLRLLTVILGSVCALLGAAKLQGQEALSRLLPQLLHLEEQNKAKDLTIEKLQTENKMLAEKLAYQLKVDDLVTSIQKEDFWLDRKIIRPAAEMALATTTDPALYLAIGLVEAGLRAKVVHTDGVALGMHGLCPKDWHSFLKAKGIMQRRDDYFDPEKSFKGSEAVLSDLMGKFGSLEKALRYYNGGRPGAAGLIPESKAYAKRVLRLRGIFAASLQRGEAYF